MQRKIGYRGGNITRRESTQIVENIQRSRRRYYGYHSNIYVSKLSINGFLRLTMSSSFIFYSSYNNMQMKSQSKSFLLPKKRRRRKRTKTAEKKRRKRNPKRRRKVKRANPIKITKMNGDLSCTITTNGLLWSPLSNFRAILL